MPKQLTQQDITKLFAKFLDEYGLSHEFETWLRAEGYKLKELGMEE